MKTRGEKVCFEEIANETKSPRCSKKKGGGAKEQARMEKPKKDFSIISELRSEGQEEVHHHPQLDTFLFDFRDLTSSIHPCTDKRISLNET